MEQSELSGYIKLHRRILRHDLWHLERFTKAQAWMDLLLKAAYEDHPTRLGSKVIQVKRGQFPASQAQLAKEWRWTRETVAKFIRYLKSAGMADMVTSKRADMGYTLITILSYDYWQDWPNSGADMPEAARHDMLTDMVADTLKKSKKRRGENAAPAGRRRSPRSNGKGTPEGYQETVDAWFTMFKAAKGSAPHFDQAEGASLRSLITRHGPQAVQQGMRQLLYHTRLPGIVNHHRYSLKTLAGFWNELASEAQARSRAEGME